MSHIHHNHTYSRFAKRFSTAALSLITSVLFTAFSPATCFISFAEATTLTDLNTNTSTDTAPAPKSDFSGQGAGFTSVLYNSSNGLPTSEANVVLQTHDGFIWIGSYSGLIRYDGTEFYRYDSSVGISSVVSLYEDSRQRLWIGTNDNGVAVLEDGTFRFYSKADGLRSSSIRSITEDNEGNILIATTFGMAYVDTTDTLHILSDPQIDQEYICELQRDNEGTIYGETLGGSFFSIRNKRVELFYNGSALGIGVVSCITPDIENPGYVYLGTEQSEVIYGNMRDGMKEYKTYSAAPQVNINRIFQDKNMLWICADNGIGYFSDNMSYVELQNIPMNNSVDNMIIDYEGDLWFASSRQGVMKTAPSLFTNLSLIAGLDDVVVNTTCQHGINLYVGTDRGLYILNSAYRLKNTPLTELLSGIRIRCIKQDLTGNLWICTYSDLGLICYHKDGTYESYTEATGLVSNRIRTVEILRDGKIAVSCSGAVYIFQDGEIIEHYDSTSGISNTEILSIAEGENGVLYLGSDGDGLYRVDGKQVSRFGLEDGLNSEVILRIKKDEERGIYWIITSNSLAYMKDEKITTINHFPYSNNFDIYFDNAGGAWVLSSNGIYVTGVDNLLEDTTPEYTLYDTKCGLPCVATANSRSAIDADGNLFIAGTTGVSLVNINDATEQSEEMKLTVPFVELDGELVTLHEGEKVNIPANCKRLTIYGYALTYSLKNPRMIYYLEGFDDEETTVSKQDMEPATYTNLKGGTYTFHLGIINTLTGKEENSISVTLVKEKAIHEYVSFWLVLGLLIATAAALSALAIVRKKTAALIAKKEENEIFIDQIIHAFAKCIDVKDTYTNGHSFRVAKYSSMLAEKMGYSAEDVKETYNIALLHDIGKISIPDNILGKPGKLTDEEYAVLKQHPQKGYEILKDIKIMPQLAIGAGYHHERLDGKGYPRGVTAEEIPLTAQIIAVADTFDAMYSTRPYRKQMAIEDVIAELRRVSGTQLNGDVVEELIAMIENGEINKETL
ncbi:MAG: HD domain-containing protein [Lachnospiraceae bacterium]|nr:HD domain-containing protein [Lachnospiraceae bacterium]